MLGSQRLRWLCLGYVLICLVAWRLSHTHYIRFVGPKFHVWIHPGAADIVLEWRSIETPANEWRCTFKPDRRQTRTHVVWRACWITYSYNGVQSGDGARIPFWMMLTPGCLLFAVNEYKRRARLRTDDCRVCGYSREGNVSGICPECGEALPSA